MKKLLLTFMAFTALLVGIVFEILFGSKINK